MHINHNKTADIRISNGDIEAFKAILGLAIRRLQSCPEQKMIGGVHRVQDGIKANDLIAVKEMLRELAIKFDLGDPRLDYSDICPDDFAKQIQKIQILVGKL